MTIQMDTKALWNMLNEKFEQDKTFSKEIEDFVSFYGTKFVTVANSEEKRTIAAEIIEDVINSQFFHGYYLQHNLILEDDSKREVFLENFWIMTPGVMRNNIGRVMEINFGENWFLQKGTENVNLRVLNELPEAFDVFRVILREAANFGAYKATLDYPLYESLVQPNDDFVFGSPFELHFLNPQVFIQAHAYSNQHELWDVFLADNGQSESQWAGSIHLSSIPTGTDLDTYILTVSLSNSISEGEKLGIVNLLCEQLPSEIRNVVQLRVFHLSELDTYMLTKPQEVK